MPLHFGALHGGAETDVGGAHRADLAGGGAGHPGDLERAICMEGIPIGKLGAEFIEPGGENECGGAVEWDRVGGSERHDATEGVGATVAIPPPRFPDLPGSIGGDRLLVEELEPDHLSPGGAAPLRFDESPAGHEGRGHRLAHDDPKGVAGLDQGRREPGAGRHPGEDLGAADPEFEVIRLRQLRSIQRLEGSIDRDLVGGARGEGLGRGEADGDRIPPLRSARDGRQDLEEAGRIGRHPLQRGRDGAIETDRDHGQRAGVPLGEGPQDPELGRGVGQEADGDDGEPEDLGAKHGIGGGGSGEAG